MKTKARYEWDVETVEDVHGDVIDHNQSDSLDADFDRWLANDPPAGHHYEIALVRDVWDDCDGLVDRHWAYVEDGKLAELLTGGMADDIHVPAKYRGEFNRWQAGRKVLA